MKRILEQHNNLTFQKYSSYYNEAFHLDVRETAAEMLNYVFNGQIQEVVESGEDYAVFDAVIDDFEYPENTVFLIIGNMEGDITESDLEVILEDVYNSFVPGEDVFPTEFIDETFSVEKGRGGDAPYADFYINLLVGQPFDYEKHNY